MFTKKIFNKKILFLLITLGLFFVASKVFAAEGDFGLNNQFSDTSGLGALDLRVVIANIIRAVLGFLGIIAVIIILYAGFTWMTSGGNEEKIGQAKKTLINAVIGLVIILSALTIVQFVISALTGGNDNPAVDRGGGGPVFQTFVGSGALGRVVKDHYPFRDETDVFRNTRITVTFRDAINPASLIENSNHSCLATDGSVTTTCPTGSIENYGDCITSGADFNWERDCDHLKTDVVGIYTVSSTGSYDLLTGPVSSTALAVYEAGGNVYTIVIRPLELLGDNINPVWYRVNLNGGNNDGVGIMKKDSDTASIFSDIDNEYHWWFQTGITADFAPPTVESVYPTDDSTVARNTIVQINFSEAMDPTTVQGMINNGENSFTNLIFNNTTTLNGEWKISNAYRTVEFVSTDNCGGVKNSCGDSMYCLPTQNFTVLARTANPMPDTWEAYPFTGITDMSGNALDGNGDNTRQGKPTMPADQREIFNLEISIATYPDNYFWNFIVNGAIDTESPYIREITPSVDQPNVSGDTELSILFSLPMWKSTLYDIKLEEYPFQADIREIWYSPLSIDEENAYHQTQTRTFLRHRIFGPNNTDLFYFPSIPGTTKSLTQNCMYPGRGPSFIDTDNDNNECANNGTGCVNVSTTAELDTGCAHSQGGNTVTSTLEDCLSIMHAITDIRLSIPSP